MTVDILNATTEHVTITGSPRAIKRLLECAAIQYQTLAEAVLDEGDGEAAMAWFEEYVDTRTLAQDIAPLVICDNCRADRDDMEPDEVPISAEQAATLERALDVAAEDFRQARDEEIELHRRIENPWVDPTRDLHPRE